MVFCIENLWTVLDVCVIFKAVAMSPKIYPRKFSGTVNMRFDYVPEIGDIIGRNGRLCPRKFSETVNMRFD